MSNDARYEIKFILDESEYTRAMRWLHTHMHVRTSYPSRVVHSIYFDDCEFSSIKDNLSGVSDRQKIRLRWYEDKDKNFSQPFLEIKKRTGRLGYKKHIKTPGLSNKIASLRADEIRMRIESDAKRDLFGCNIFDRHLTPVMYINYKRDYYEDLSGIRVTIDSDIKFHSVSSHASISRLKPIKYSPRIMEIKFPVERKNQVSALLKNLHLTPKRHSKYLMGMSKFGQAVYF